MEKHKFAVGASVEFTARPFEAAARGTYKVTRQLPSAEGELLYRIKSAEEPHERIARESQLSR